MKTRSALVLTGLCLLSVDLHAAETDAAGCKDHPLLPRLPGYHIVACGSANASFDLETATGEPPETIHVEGDSWAVAYKAPAGLEPKPGRDEILSRFEQAVGKHGVTLVGRSNELPVYRLVNGGKETWVVVIAHATGGGYAYRVIEQQNRVETKKEEDEDRLNCVKQYGKPLFETLAGYEICGCGEQEAGTRTFRTTKGKTLRVAGRVTQMTYCPKQARGPLSDEQIRRGFKQRIKAQGGKRIGGSPKDPRIDVYRLTADGAEAWVEVWVEEDGNYNHVVTRGVQQPE